MGQTNSYERLREGYEIKKDYQPSKNPAFENKNNKAEKDTYSFSSEKERLVKKDKN